MKKITKLNKACPQYLKHSFCRRGFTLIETLVAISIFTTSLLGIMSVLASSISSTTYAKQKMVASYLAQEGIEFVRNMRDTYVLYDSTNTQTGWNAFNAKLTSAGATCQTGCYFNNGNTNYANHTQATYKSNLSLISCSSASCTNGALLYDSSTGKYGFASGTSSGFTRKVQTSVAGGGNETDVTSTVTWKQGTASYSITFSEALFNWME